MKKSGRWDRIRRIFELPDREEIDRELEFHIEMRAEELEAEGWSEDAARREALRLLGDRGAVGDRMYRVSTRDRRRRRLSEMWGGLFRDVRFAGRTLRRSPGFTLTVLAVLSLGIGANVSIFSAANAVLFRPLPFGDPDALYMLYETNPDFGWVDVTAAPANLLDWAEQVTAFEAVSAHADFLDRPALLREGGATVVGASAVMGNFFDALGVTPAMGRPFRMEETWEGGDPVVVLSHELWSREFGADPGVLGRTIPLESGPRRVVGVMPPGFTYPHPETDLWIPMGWPADARAEPWFRRAHFMRGFARLAPGVTAAEADAELQAVVARLEAEYPDTNTRMGAGMAPMRDFLARGSTTQLLVLMGAVTLLLLLAAANVANLILVRGRGREREIRIRSVLGAERGRLLAQLGAECGLLALVAGGIGLALGWTGVRGIARIQPLGIAGVTDLALDPRVAGFALGASLVCALLASVGPVWHLVRRGSSASLRESARGSSPDRGTRRAARVLVAFEVAVAVVLVAGAGLMIRSYGEIRSVDPGFTVEPVTAFLITLPEDRYPDGEAVNGYFDRLTESLEGRPGIERAGTIEALPLAGSSWSSQFQAENWSPERVGFEVLHRRADPGYFQALDIPLVRGRMFEPSDRAGPLTVLVNEAFAREHFPDEDPVGTRIAFTREASSSSTWYEIIGVVGDQRQNSPTIPTRAEVFENRHQDWGREAWVVLRTSGDPAASIAVARSAVEELDPLVPIARTRSMSEVWRTSVGRERLVLLLLVLFGATALAMAVVGVYGVTAEAARLRTREIGIRMALGARAREIGRMMLRQGLGVVLGGLALGLLASLLLTRTLAAYLFEVSPADPLTLTVVTLVLAGAAGAASYLPARRAARLDPSRSLRAD